MPARAPARAGAVRTDVPPSNVMVPPANRLLPVMARSSEVLPTPLRPMTQVTLPISADDGDRAQGLRRAVMEVEVFDDFQHSSRPR
jgi:hypothetical protein